MTVQELINKLEEFPKDMRVMSQGDDIEKVYISEDYPLGDPANPKCKYTDVVVIY